MSNLIIVSIKLLVGNDTASSWVGGSLAVVSVLQATRVIGSSTVEHVSDAQTAEAGQVVSLAVAADVKVGEEAGGPRRAQVVGGIVHKPCPAHNCLDLLDIVIVRHVQRDVVYCHFGAGT